MSGEDSTDRAGLDQAAPQLPAISARTSSGSVQQQTTYHQHGGESKEEKAAARHEGDLHATLVLLQRQLHGFGEWQRHIEQQMTAMQQQRAAAEQYKGEYDAHRAANGAADTLPTPVSTFRYLADRRPANPRRLTFGQALSYPPDSPASPETAQQAEAATAATAAASATAAADAEASEEKLLRRLKDALVMAKGHVDPFYADKTMDKNVSVLDFVEKIESAMSDCGLPQRLRLTMVRWFLKEAPMRWVNGKLLEMQAQAVREGRDLQQRPIDWDADLRRQFINKYVGPESTELRLGELSALSVGKEGGRGKTSQFTAHSPSELEGQFDKIARHLYARTATDDDRNDLLLVLKYKEIIHKSQPDMYERIVLNCRHDELMSLREWKAEFAHMWARFEELDVAKAAAAAVAHTGGEGRYGRGRGSWRGRGGWTSSPPVAKASVSAMSEGGTNLDGEAFTAEGEPDTQLSAASSSQRGGRGGNSGRGRGRSGGRAMAAERQQLYNEGKCFTCKKTGHIASDCPSAATLSAAAHQSNEQAGQ